MYKEVIVSIIVPVYNAEKVILNFLESMNRQNWDQAELIIVDDGSTDTTRKFLRKWLQNTNKVMPKIVFCSNSGPSVARNIGMEVSKGTFVRFLDVDDEYSDDLVRNTVHLVSKNDSVDFWLTPHYELVNGYHNKKNLVGRIQNIDELIKLITTYKIEIYSFSFIVKRELGHSVGFDEELRMSEDQNFVFRLAAFFSRMAIDVGDSIDYTYVVRQTSLSHGNAIEIGYKSLLARRKSADLFSNKKHLQRSLNNLIFGQLFDLYMLTQKDDLYMEIKNMYWKSKIPLVSRIKKTLLIIKRRYTLKGRN